MKLIRKVLVKIIGIKAYLQLISKVYLLLMRLGFFKEKYAELHFVQKLVQPNDVVLDIGGATGYSAAILSSLASTVVSVEQDEEFIRLGFVFIMDGMVEQNRAFQSARLLKTFLAEVFPQLAAKMGQMIPAEQLYFSKKVRAPWLNIWAGYRNPFGIGTLKSNYQNRFVELAEEAFTFNQVIKKVLLFDHVKRRF